MSKDTQTVRVSMLSLYSETSDPNTRVIGRINFAPSSKAEVEWIRIGEVIPPFDPNNYIDALINYVTNHPDDPFKTGIVIYHSNHSTKHEVAKNYMEALTIVTHKKRILQANPDAAIQIHVIYLD